VLAAPRDWSRIPLDCDAKAALAKAAHVLRFGDADGGVATPSSRSSCSRRAAPTIAPMIFARL